MTYAVVTGDVPDVVVPVGLETVDVGPGWAGVAGAVVVVDEGGAGVVVGGGTVVGLVVGGAGAVGGGAVGGGAVVVVVVVVESGEVDVGSGEVVGGELVECGTVLSAAVIIVFMIGPAIDAPEADTAWSGTTTEMATTGS